jgi:hypothetical protein
MRATRSTLHAEWADEMRASALRSASNEEDELTGVPWRLDSKSGVTTPDDARVMMAG